MLPRGYNKKITTYKESGNSEQFWKKKAINRYQFWYDPEMRMIKDITAATLSTLHKIKYTLESIKRNKWKIISEKLRRVGEWFYKIINVDRGEPTLNNSPFWIREFKYMGGKSSFNLKNFSWRFASLVLNRNENVQSSVRQPFGSQGPLVVRGPVVDDHCSKRFP